MEIGGRRRVIRCEEWEAIRVGVPDALLSFEEVGQIFQRWKTQTGTSPEAYFDLRGNSLTPRNWSGVAPGEDVQLEVLPMGASTLESNQLEALDKNISLMLQASLTGGSMELAEGELAQFGQRVQAILAAFCRQLSKARRRQVIRRYTSVRMATRCARGRIVFPNQVFESIRRPGYFASEWVALDEDTAENRFIKAVLSRFRPRASGGLRYKVDELLCEFEAVSLPSTPLKEWRQIRFDRLSRDYGEILRLGKSLLDGEAPGLFSGLTSASTEIVFTARAFETFVGSEIARTAESQGYVVKRQNRGQHLGKWVGGAYDSRNVFELIPDIELSRRGENSSSCVIDTKWKRLVPGSSQYGIKLDDIYQVVTYAVRFGHSHCVLAYPWVGEGSPLGGPRYVSMPLNTAHGSIQLLVLFVPMLQAGFPGLRAHIEAMLDAIAGK